MGYGSHTAFRFIGTNRIVTLSGRFSCCTTTFTSIKNSTPCIDWKFKRTWRAELMYKSWPHNQSPRGAKYFVHSIALQRTPSKPAKLAKALTTYVGVLLLREKEWRMLSVVVVVNRKRKETREKVCPEVESSTVVREIAAPAAVGE